MSIVEIHTCAFPTLFPTDRQHVPAVATPIGAHVVERLEAMRNTMVDLFLIRVRFCIGLADTLCDDTRVALLVACQSAI